MSKYKIGEKYLIDVWNEPLQMEYLGQVKNLRYNGCSENVCFDVFQYLRYGKPDILALWNGKFFARSYDGSVEGLVHEVRKTFVFEGKGHTHVVTGATLAPTVEEFRAQTKGLLTPDEIEEAVLKGNYILRNKNGGEIKYCPTCKVIKQTSCSACGCGSCGTCGYRWTCMPVKFPTGTIVTLPTGGMVGFVV